MLSIRLYVDECISVKVFVCRLVASVCAYVHKSECEYVGMCINTCTFVCMCACVQI